MTRQRIRNDWQRDQFIEQLKAQPLPLSASFALGEDRTGAQNALVWKWATEISAQKGDETPDDIHAYNKLHHGVPIMRAEDEVFAAVYDEVIKPLPYEQKLLLMKGDFFKVTSLMKVKQLTRCLDAVSQDWTRRGFILTIPEEKR